MYKKKHVLCNINSFHIKCEKNFWVIHRDLDCAARLKIEQRITQHSLEIPTSPFFASKVNHTLQNNTGSQSKWQRYQAAKLWSWDLYHAPPGANETDLQQKSKLLIQDFIFLIGKMGLILTTYFLHLKKHLRSIKIRY